MTSSAEDSVQAIPEVRINSWGRLDNFPSQKWVLSTRTSTEEELLSHLDFYARVDDAIQGTIAAGGAKEVTPALVIQIQAFLRQAMAFWKAARSLDVRSCPLLYYYSLLNLAKALIAVYEVEKLPSRINHGITCRADGTDLRDHMLQFKRDGVFPRLYRCVLGDEIPDNESVRVSDLLSYCFEISYELTSLNLVPVKFHPFYMRFAVSNTSVSVCTSFDKASRSTLINDPIIKSIFREIALDPHTARNLFDYLAPQHGNSAYFQSTHLDQYIPGTNKIDSGALLKGVFGKVANRFDSLLTTDPKYPDCLFYEQTPSKACFNELVAGFGVIFYLGSLVRYQPEILESLLNSKEGWLIERLVRQVPHACLHRFINKLSRTERLYSIR